MFQCENGEACVRVSAMCWGYALCSDKSDLKECDSNLKCVTNTWSTNTLHSLESGHHYCQYHETDNDGKYDNIGRKDEDTLDVTSDQLVIDYNELEQCNGDGSKTDKIQEFFCGGPCVVIPGRYCGGTCVENYEWCRTDRSFKCSTLINQPKFSSNNPKICGNFSFWSEVSCEIITIFWDKPSDWLHLRGLPAPYPTMPPDQAYVDYPSMMTAAAGKRCISTLQHCYYPWYTVLYTYHDNNQGRLKKTCYDKSDQIFEINDCKSFPNYLDVYKSLFCTPAYYYEVQQEAWRRKSFGHLPYMN